MQRQIELVRACAWCSRVHDGGNEWRDLEAFLRARFGIDFSHGICPDCLRDHDCPARQEEDS